MSWATNHDASLERLLQVQGSLTVDLIMVVRDDFVTCTSDETASRIKSRNTQSFSYFPVVDANKRVIGLYHAERWFDADAPDTPIGDDFALLSEDTVIGADASIIDFIMRTNEHPTALVVSGSRIAGLVSLSDLQRLPVRASLFALITSLEMAMALAIEKRWPAPSDWMRLLSPGRWKELRTAIEEAKKQDGFVSEIAFAQLHDKADIVRKGELLDISKAKLKLAFRRIGKLRDNIAHANQYAATPEAARSVCEVVRCVYGIKADLLGKIEALRASA